LSFTCDSPHKVSEAEDWDWGDGGGPAVEGA